MFEMTDPGTSTRHHLEDDPISTPSAVPQTSFIHAMEDDDRQSQQSGDSVLSEDEVEDDDEEVDVFVDELLPPAASRSKRKSGRRKLKSLSSLSPQEQQQTPRLGGGPTTQATMSAADVGIFQRLDAEYDRAMEDREVAYAARYNSVRQSACFAVTFMILFMTLGTVYFMKQNPEWRLEDALFFGIYTITTVGYGQLDTPETPAFQIYTIFFLLIGIATLTIMVAQVYQCIALEAGRAQHSRDHLEMARRGLDVMALRRRCAPSSPNVDGANESAADGNEHTNHLLDKNMLDRHLPVPMVDRCFECFDRTKHFLVHNEIGRGLSVLLPFVTLITVGATVVGILEEWTVVESVYFAVVSLTTVGYGDYFPMQSSSRLFCIFWLPFSVGFMSLYLGNIAAFYIRLSDRNIARIERHLRRRMDAIKQLSQREREEARRRALRGQEATPLSGREHHSENAPAEQGFETVPAAQVVVVDQVPSLPNHERRPLGPQTQERRARVLQNHLQHGKKTSSKRGGGSLSQESVSTMATMRNVIDAVYANLKPSSLSHRFTSGPESEYLSYRSSRVVRKSSLNPENAEPVRKPSFALRVLVQERFAEIIATEVAGFQNEIAIKDSTLSVTIDSLSATAEKWLIPRRARRAFRAVAFEALYFVGEHGLITRGANALYDLNPFEFHGLFAPLLAAFGDADTMEGWLGTTEILAEYDLRKGGTSCDLDEAANTRPPSPPRSRGEDKPSLKQPNQKMIV